MKMSELRQPTSGRAKFLILLTAAAMTAVPAMAAAAPPPTAPPATASPAPRTAAPAQRPANPDYAPDQPDTSEATPVPAPLPPAVWDAASAAALLQYIEQIGVEGLNPADYDPEGLKAALASGDPVLFVVNARRAGSSPAAGAQDELAARQRAVSGRTAASEVAAYMTQLERDAKIKRNDKAFE